MWLNKDPIGEEGGINLYGCCGNNLLSNFDSLGLDWDWSGAVSYLSGFYRAAAIAAIDTWHSTANMVDQNLGIGSVMSPLNDYIATQATQLYGTVEHRVFGEVPSGTGQTAFWHKVGDWVGKTTEFVLTLSFGGGEGQVGTVARRTRIMLDSTMDAIGEWRPGFVEIFINRTAVRQAAELNGRTIAQELYITAYHEAFHRAVYPIDRLASRICGVDDIYGASKAAMEAGVGKGWWYRFEEWGAESWGKLRASIRDVWGIK